MSIRDSSIVLRPSAYGLFSLATDQPQFLISLLLSGIICYNRMRGCACIVSDDTLYNNAIPSDVTVIACAQGLSINVDLIQLLQASTVGARSVTH